MDHLQTYCGPSGRYMFLGSNMIFIPSQLSTYCDDLFSQGLLLVMWNSLCNSMPTWVRINLRKASKLLILLMISQRVLRFSKYLALLANLGQFNRMWAIVLLHACSAERSICSSYNREMFLERTMASEGCHHCR